MAAQGRLSWNTFGQNNISMCLFTGQSKKPMSCLAHFRYVNIKVDNTTYIRTLIAPIKAESIHL